MVPLTSHTAPGHAPEPPPRPEGADPDQGGKVVIVDPLHDDPAAFRAVAEALARLLGPMPKR